MTLLFFFLQSQLFFKELFTLELFAFEWAMAIQIFIVMPNGVIKVVFNVPNFEFDLV